MTAATIVCHDLYLRHTDTEGRSHVRMHRVWDSTIFLDARQAEADNMNANVKGDGKRLAKAEQITIEQFKKESRRA